MERFPCVFVAANAVFFNGTADHHELFLWQLNQVFFKETWGHLQMFIWLPNGYFKPNHGIFITLNQVVSVPNLTRPQETRAITGPLEVAAYVAKNVFWRFGCYDVIDSCLTFL